MPQIISYKWVNTPIDKKSDTVKALWLQYRWLNAQIELIRHIHIRLTLSSIGKLKK